MYIFGNAKQLSSANDMWKTIIDELSEQELVGPGLPIACDRHGTVTYVFEPGELALVAPEGEYG
jgi:hypothetical protein